jgi:hypothetical protein
MPGGPVITPAQRKSRKGNSSILGDIGHVLSGTGKGLYHGLTGLPTGAYMLGRNAAHDTGMLLSGKEFSNNPPPLRTSGLIKNIAKQEYESYRHFGKGGDISGPILDASALLTGGASLGARAAKVVSEVSKASKAQRAAHALELQKKDAAVMQAVGGSGIKGAGFDRMAKITGFTSSELKKHYSRNREFLQEGNFSVGKPAGQQGKYANVTPKEVLKDPAHPMYDHYVRRYPDHPSKTKAGVSNVTRARKAFMAEPQYSRPLLYGKRFDKKSSGLRVPTSPNPLFRATRAGIEQLRPETSANREILKETTRRQVTQTRFNAPKGVRMARKAQDIPQNRAEKAIGMPMSALRMAMWLRPRYYLQNIAQTGQMLAANPALTAKSTKLASELYRTNRPLYHQVRAVTGEAQAGALATGTSPSRFGSFLGKRIPGGAGQMIRDKGLQGAMGHAANIPESHVRALSVLNELQKHNRSMGSLGDLTPAKVEQAFNNVRRGGVISPEHLPMRRAVEEVGDFSRIFSARMLKHRGMGEREFMKTQVPIFYPMYKALTRYGVRIPSEHAAIAAETVALGKQGKKEQKRLLGELPFWAQYLVPKSAGDPNAVRSSHQAVFNPANIYNLQPVTDVGRQTAELARKGGPNPGVSYLQESGPAPQIAYGLMTGKDWQTGYPIKPFSKRTYKQHPSLNRSLINVPYDWASSLPLSDLERIITGQRPHVRSYVPGTSRDRLLQELLGPSVIDRTLNTKETRKQAKRETRYGQGRKPKKKSGYDG